VTHWLKFCIDFEPFRRCSQQNIL